jgi:acetolactate synthase regulatory subunit
VQQIISLLMENKPGALMRVTGLLGQRGYNIESLTVGRTLDPTLSRMTITVDVEPNIRTQVIKQMNGCDGWPGGESRTGAGARQAEPVGPHRDSERG